MEVVARFLNILPVKKQAPRESPAQERRAMSLIDQDGWTPPLFDPAQVRLVLFRDHEGRGKMAIFDTKVHLNSVGSDSDYVHSPSSTCSLSHSTRTCNDDSFTSSLTSSCTASMRSRAPLIRRPSSDAELLGEMMFGSMPMKLAGNTLKIHYVRSEQQLLLTKLFTTQHRMMPSCSVTDFSDSCPLPGESPAQNIENSIGPSTCIPKNRSFSHSLRPPSQSPDHGSKLRSNSFGLSPCPSPSASLPISLNASYNQEISPTQSLTPGIPMSTSSLSSSLTRRLQRARSTSLENASELFHRVLKPMDQNTTSYKRGRKYAIGVIFSLVDMKPHERNQFQDFLFSHFTLISCHLEQLREKIEEALWNRRQLLPEVVTNAYHTFVDDFRAVYCAQRIKAPIWLSVVRSNQGRRDICKKFLSEFSSIVAQIDTKETKFFFSALLTSVLSNHLAWMYTVSKNGSATSRHHDKMASKSLAVLAETHPYNPLWAQLGDLYGAVSDPLTICRTIITGKNASLVYRLLFILTYFIRCSEIEQQGGFRKILENHSHFLLGLEESDRYPQESRTGSAVTLMSDTNLQNSLPVSHSITASSSFERSEQPLIKPHPFSFSRGDGFSRPSSRSGSLTEIPKCNSYSAISSHSMYMNLQSSPCNISNSLQYPPPQPNSGYTPLVCSSVPLSLQKAGNGNKFRDIAPRSNTVERSCVATTSLKQPSLKSNHFHQGVQNSKHFGDRKPWQQNEPSSSHCNCHFQEKQNCCARQAIFFSMGQCPIDEDMVYWRPHQSHMHGSLHVNSSLLPGGYSNYETGFFLHKDCSSSFPKQNEMNSYKLHECSSTESLSTGYQTLSRNPSGCSLGGYTNTSLSIPHITSNSHGNFGSCDSGVSEHVTSLTSTTDSGQFSGRDIGSRQTQQGKHRSNFISATHQTTMHIPITHQDVESSLRLQSQSTSHQTSQPFFTSRTVNSSRRSLWPNEHTHSHTDAIYTSSLPYYRSNPDLEPHHANILSHDRLHMLQGSLDKRNYDVHVLPGISHSSAPKDISHPRRFKSKAFEFHQARTNEVFREKDTRSSFSQSWQQNSTMQGGFRKYDESIRSSSVSPQPTMSGYNKPTVVSNRAYGDRLPPKPHNASFQHGTFLHTHSSKPGPTLSLGSGKYPTTRSVSSPNFFMPPGQFHPPSVNVTDPLKYNKSWTGLPLLEGVCPELVTGSFGPDNNEFQSDSVSYNSHYGAEEGLQMAGLKKMDQISVEESLSVNSILMLGTSPLAREIENPRSGMKFVQQFQDFTKVDISSIEDDFVLDLTAPLSPPPKSLQVSPPQTPQQSTHIPMETESHLIDFGHSLMAGYSEKYLPDFVLHGTSQPLSEFKEKLISDLSNVVKHSIVDEPIQHGVAIVADTDTMTCKLFIVSKSKRTPDGEVLIGTAHSSCTVQKMMHSVASLWEMHMPPEFCLSHLEDSLMELNERGQMLSTGLLEHNQYTDFSSLLQLLHNNMNTPSSDQPMLQALASVHSSSCDRNISAALQTSFLHSLVK